MDTRLDGLDWAQEEFYQAFDVRMEDIEEDVQVLKNDMDVVKIKMSSVHKDIKDIEASVDNAHFWLEKVED